MGPFKGFAFQRDLTPGVLLGLHTGFKVWGSFYWGSIRLLMNPAPSSSVHQHRDAGGGGV